MGPLFWQREMNDGCWSAAGEEEEGEKKIQRGAGGCLFGKGKEKLSF